MALSREPVQQTKTDLAFQVFDAFNRRDIDAAIAMVDEDVEFFAPTAEMANEGKPYVGHAGMRKYYEDVAAVWQELEVTPSEIREVDDAVLALGRVYGRADGGYIQDSPAQWVMRFRGDRISWIRVYTNRSAAFAEVGLEE
jgi:ketosteroid isomerase-like protein